MPAIAFETHDATWTAHQAPEAHTLKQHIHLNVQDHFGGQPIHKRPLGILAAGAGEEVKAVVSLLLDDQGQICSIELVDC